MTVRWTVRAAEPTAAFTPQRKCKNVGSNPAPATKKKDTVRCPLLFAGREKQVIMGPKGIVD